MANYGKILGSEAFSKGTDYAARVGAQTRAIQTQTSELEKKQASSMFDLAHKGYEVIKGAQKKKKMFDMLAGSQGYEKQEKKELSFLGNAATLGGAISWGQQDYYSKGEGDDKKFYSRKEASENITQSMYDMINKGQDYVPGASDKGGIGQESMHEKVQEKNWMYKQPSDHEKMTKYGIYDEPPSGDVDRFADDKSKDVETTTETKVEEVKPIEVKEKSQEIGNDANSADASSESATEVPVSVAYEGLADQNNKISKYTGAPKGGLNAWLRDEKGLKTKAEQREWKENMWSELSLKEEVS